MRGLVEVPYITADVRLVSLSLRDDVESQAEDVTSPSSSIESSATSLDAIRTEELSTCNNEKLLFKHFSEVDEKPSSTDVDTLTLLVDNLCLDITSDSTPKEAVAEVTDVQDSIQDNSSDILASTPHVEIELAGLRIAEPEITPLSTLLGLCEQQDARVFSAHVSKLLDRSYHFRKIGEASYSEVFEQYQPGLKGSTVLKIIPFGGEEDCAIKDIIQELKITKTLSGLEGFIGFRG